MRIGELAGQFGLNPKTIRYYEEIGLLPRPERTPAGYRLYGAEDRDRLDFILKARAIGLALDEIAQILALRRRGERPCAHVLALLDRKIAAIDAQIRALAAVRGELAALGQEAVKSGPPDARVCAIIEHHPRLDRAAPPLLDLHTSSSRPRRAPAPETARRTGSRPPGRLTF